MLKINDKEYQLRYTLESWKKLKKEHDVTPTNFSEKVNDDPARYLSALIFYGLSPEDRKTLTQDQIDCVLDFTAIDIVKQSVLASVPKADTEKKSLPTNE